MLLLIGLGGNRGDVLAAFAGAVAGLSREVRVLARSSIWRSAPVGPAQEDFLNAAVLVETSTHPRALLAVCQRLEAAAGRDRSLERRWGPRTLDLDLLLANRLVIESGALVLPHPRFAERRFTLAPAAELAPEWWHPRLWRTLKELSEGAAVAGQRCELVVPSGDWPGAHS